MFRMHICPSRWLRVPLGWKDNLFKRGHQDRNESAGKGYFPWQFQHWFLVQAFDSNVCHVELNGDESFCSEMGLGHKVRGYVCEEILLNVPNPTCHPVDVLDFKTHAYWGWWTLNTSASGSYQVEALYLLLLISSDAVYCLVTSATKESTI